MSYKYDETDIQIDGRRDQLLPLDLTLYHSRRPSGAACETHIACGAKPEDGLPGAANGATEQ
eukprot:364504-Prymnesium_polylepis.1